MKQIHVHFLGIGGSGASAVAAIAQNQGWKVSGCDNYPYNDYTKNFDQNFLIEGHSTEHLEGVQILAVTPAVFSQDPHNPELLGAKNKGIKVVTWQQFMGEFLEKDKFVIAICGTHGKSTTTAMVGQLLEDAGLDPTVELGAIVPKWEKNYRVGRGGLALSEPVLSEVEVVEGYFVTEADEFNDNFLASHPQITIITSIEMDHPEYFKNFEDYKKSFKKFLSQTKGKIIANLSDPGVNQTLASHLGGGNVIIDYSKNPIEFDLKIPGQYNILNASAVYQLGLALKIDPKIIQKSLQSFNGIGRRFEYLGQFKGADIYSDFAHHPTEIKVTMTAAREKFPDKKIIMVFQPHMFSRTFALFDDFAKVFQNIPVDKIYIMDIYPSREIDTGLVTSNQLVEATNRDNVQYLKGREEVLDKLQTEAKKGDVIFFTGAGITDEIAKSLVKN
ncbi:MAG: UDP-N-acetylmuramate--L-alanine ligase [Patescibacteria group bacterium]|nr:UDP-N-acetylmuramate--L-alanine ligase [Patescibacteria group bacterium]